jgi:hypothetical protein
MHCGDQGRQFPVQDEQPRVRNRPAVRRVAPSETKPAPTSESPSKFMQPKNLLILLGALFFASIAPAESSAATAATGTLSGSVSNAATGNLLAGAAVEVPALGRRVVTDPSGRYLLSELPAGTHEIVVSYLGLDSVRERLAVAAERATRRDFELTTAIYQLDAFKVVGEREGSAAAITEKRNAGNVKDVVAMDQFGNLPNLSTGEVVMRLPGVAGSPSDEGISGRFMTRGMDAALNTVTVDGSQISISRPVRRSRCGRSAAPRTTSWRGSRRRSSSRHRSGSSTGITR